LALGTASHIVETALAALNGGGDWRPVLDELPAPVYTTDPEGAVTYWNRACIDFAGRHPELGSDRWCVTWELYTTMGERLPHSECPMAEAIKERREVRDKIAIALRPDGTRRAFKAYPTPLFAGDGSLAGAVNVLIDVTEQQTSELSDQAARCRRLANATTDPEAAGILATMATGFAATAASLGSRS
jgi:PAS domain S-box-containing protein